MKCIKIIKGKISLALFFAFAFSGLSYGASKEIVVPDESVGLYGISDVRIMDGDFAKAAEANRQYLLAHSVDRLLASFRREAGLEPKAQQYGNWESMGLEGHSAGHYLSGISLMIASGNDPDGEFARRLNYMVDELEIIQKANGDGYLGGIVDGKAFWKRIAEGDVAHTNSKWAPWYNLHKMYAGLYDAYIHGGNEKAKKLLMNYADWCEKFASGLSEQQMQRMLGVEYGGMNEALANLYTITGEKKYLELAKRFNHRSVFEPLENQQDRLTGMHANTLIPKIVGMQRIAALDGDGKLHTGAEFFWKTVTENRSIAFGGNSVSEHFNDPKDFSGMVEHRQGPESCNTYNMLKLTRELFKSEPKAEYMDYYERALYNHILASINIERPGYVYFTSIRPGHYRNYSQPEVAFWCCVGTGMENPGKYGEMIYAKGKDGIYVNLFIPSVLTDNDRNLVLRQETAFPDQGKTNLTFELAQPKTFTLNIRHPNWVSTEGFAVKVNGQLIAVKSDPSSYLSVRRQWKNGDKVEVSLPMKTVIERLPDGSDWVSFKHGPVVLAAPCGDNDLDHLFADGSRMGQVASGPMVPMDKVQVILAEADNLTSSVVADPSAGPMHFRLKTKFEPAAPQGVELMPFFRLHEQRYQMYWQLSSEQEIAQRRERLAAAERARIAREEATIDSIAVGEQQPEVEHDLQGEGMETGTHNGRRWRHGAVIQYTLNPRGAKEAVLAVTYSGDDGGREFDILVDGKVIATQRLTSEKRNYFVEKRYKIPAEILEAAGNNRITVRFVAKRQLAGGVYDVRLLKPNAPELEPFQ